MTKYVDNAAIIQVIGTVFNNSSLLDETDKYIIHEDDFTTNLHKVIFGSMYQLHKMGSKVTLDAIIDFLSNRPKYNSIFQAEKGIEYIQRASELSSLETFNYYYNRLKKFTLLRAYEKIGFDVSFLYDAYNVLDVKKKQEQEDWLDNHSINDIAVAIDEEIERVKSKYVEEEITKGFQASEGMEELIAELQENPEVGIPLYGNLINVVTRGARLKKFYLRSAPTGYGKTRTMIADACNFACDEIYDETLEKWVPNNTAEPTLFITTEQEKSEIQTMMLAFLAAVEEEHILNGKYEEGELERVKYAINVFKRSPIWVEELPDFSVQDVENKIKKHIREHNIKYLCHDYVHTSMKILEEVSSRSGGVKLREDNILFILSTKLKDLCNEYGIFIMSATQLSGDWRNNETPDQSLLRGAKAIADKVDTGMIILPVSNEDLEKLSPILNTGRYETPNMKISVYKNRRGKFKGIYMWCYAQLGKCRVQPMFITDFGHGLLNVQDIKIMVDKEDEEEVAF